MPKVRTATHAGTWYSSSGGCCGWSWCHKPLYLILVAAAAASHRTATMPCCPAASQLQQQLQQWLDEAEAEPGQHARAIIAPHAGYRCGLRVVEVQAASTMALQRFQQVSAISPLFRPCSRYSGHVAAYAYKQIDPTRV